VETPWGCFASAGGLKNALNNRANVSRSIVVNSADPIAPLIA
jgi:hypothetical protein